MDALVQEVGTITYALALFAIKNHAHLLLNGIKKPVFALLSTLALSFTTAKQDQAGIQIYVLVSEILDLRLNP